MSYYDELRAEAGFVPLVRPAAEAERDLAVATARHVIAADHDAGLVALARQFLRLARLPE